MAEQARGDSTLVQTRPTTHLLIVGRVLNFALGIICCCWHMLVVNLVILPRALRPGWFVRIGLLLVGLFFLSVATISNGPLEGTNNKIKTMKRQAYGFRDLEFLKLKILAIHRAKYALVG